MIAESVAFLVGAGKRVLFDAEHFFDGFALDPGYALDCLRAAADAGAERLVLCDTNGGSLPPQIRTAFAVVARSARRGVPLGIHTHDDSGCARRQHARRRRSGRHAGAGDDQRHRRAHRQRQPGHDHRRPAAEDGLRGARARAPGAADRDRPLRRRAAQPLARPGPAVRRQARLRAQGRAARRRRPAPTRRPSSTSTRRVVGNRRDVLISELSGKATIVEKAARGGHRAPTSELAAARASSASRSSSTTASSSRPPTARFELLHAQGGGRLRAAVPPGVLARASSRSAPTARSRPRPRSRSGSDGERYVRTAEGNGPVNALDKALRDAIGEIHPHLRDIELVNFKVRILDETKGTGAVTRVLIDASDGHDVWGSIGVSENLIAASWDALVDSLEYGMQPGGRARPAERERARTRAAQQSSDRARGERRRSRSPGRCWARPRSARCSRCCARGSSRSGPRRAASSSGASPRASARRWRAPSAAARPGCTSRCARSGVERRRRGRHEPVLVRRLGQRRALRARAAGVRRHRPGDAQPRPAGGRGRGDASARARCCRCTSSATRPTCRPSRRWPRGTASAIVEDACEALGRRPRATAPPVGGRGHPAVFGFYANKQLTTGEGGMVTLGDAGAEGADRLRAQPGPRARHGLARPRPARLQLPPLRHRLRARHRAARAPATRCSPRARASPRSTARRSPGSRASSCRARTRTATRRGWFVFVVQLPARRRPRRDRARAGRGAASRASPTCPRST